MKTKITIILTMFVLLSSSMFAQEGKKAVVKLNLVKALNLAPYIQGEYAFHKNISFALGISGWRRGLPNRFVNQFAQNDTERTALESFKLGMYSITPEIRFYLGKKEEHQAPHGFYLAPYMKYSRYKLTLPFSYIDPTLGSYDFVGKMRSIGFGLMMGSQWVTKSGFTFDWWILGAHRSKSTLDMTVNGDFSSVSSNPNSSSRLETESELNDLFSGLPGNPSATFNWSPNSFNIVSKFNTIGIRGMGFNFGWAF